MVSATTTEQFIAAATRGDVATIRSMVETDPRVVKAASPAGERAIHAAYYHDHREIVGYLIEHGELEDVWLDTQLGRIDRVTAHIDRDPELARTPQPTGTTLLHQAVFWGHPDIVRLLLERGADVMHATGYGYTALHSAVAAPTTYCPGEEEDVVLEIVQMLLDHGADPNALTSGGHTPIFTAAANGDLRVVQLLVERGGDATTRSHPGDSPYAARIPADIAGERGHNHVVDYLNTLTGRQAPAG